MASLFAPAVQVPHCETMDPIDGGAWPCTCQSQRILLWAAQKSTGRHNQVEVQDRKWPPSPDEVNHGHAREQTTSNILKGLSVSLGRHISSKALIS